MKTIHDLRLETSKALVGEAVQPSNPGESLELYLYEVARHSLKRMNDYYVMPGTKAFHKLSEEQAKEHSVKMVSKWLNNGNAHKAYKGGQGEEEDILMALLKNGGMK